MVLCCFNSTRTLSGADLALQDTGALAAAEYGRLAVWEHSPLFSGPGAASIAAGRCISAGDPSRALTRFRFLILAFVCHAYPAFVLHPRFHQKNLRLFVGFSFFKKVLFSVWTSAHGLRRAERWDDMPSMPSEVGEI